GREERVVRRLGDRSRERVGRRVEALGAEAERPREAGDAPLAGGEVSYAAGDVRRLPFRSGSLDYVMEQTLYCAIDPGDRPLYVAEVARVLAPGGRVLGLFYERDPPGELVFCAPGAKDMFSTGRDELVVRVGVDRPVAL